MNTVYFWNHGNIVNSEQKFPCKLHRYTENVLKNSLSNSAPALQVEVLDAGTDAAPAPLSPLMDNILHAWQNKTLDKQPTATHMETQTEDGVFPQYGMYTPKQLYLFNSDSLNEDPSNKEMLFGLWEDFQRLAVGSALMLSGIPQDPNIWIQLHKPQPRPQFDYR